MLLLVINNNIEFLTSIIGLGLVPSWVTNINSTFFLKNTECTMEFKPNNDISIVFFGQRFNYGMDTENVEYYFEVKGQNVCSDNSLEFYSSEPQIHSASIVATNVKLSKDRSSYRFIFNSTESPIIGHYIVKFNETEFNLYTFQVSSAYLLRNISTIFVWGFIDIDASQLPSRMKSL